MSDSPDEDDKHVREAWLATLRQDLIAPVSAVVGFGEILRDEVADRGPREAAADLDRILNAAHDLKSLVDRLLQHDWAQKLTADGDDAVKKLRHDLRTPINAIKGYGEMLQEDLEDLQAQHLEKDLSALLEHAEILLSKIDTLAALSQRAPGTDLELPDIPPEAAAMFSELVQSMRPVRDDQPGQVGTGKILVVDDLEANRTLLARRLRRDGHQVTTAEGGVRGLALMSHDEFDLVLLDLMMPDMNGFEVLARLKADQSLHQIPVIMISALDEIDSVVRCIEAGAEDYLPKPFDPVLLQARINAALEKKRSRERERLYLDRLESEKEKYERLLLNILPQQIVSRLNAGETMIADRYDDVTVLFSDMVGFTEMSANLPPTMVVQYLNQVFSLFDREAHDLGVEKIKMIGDAYMVVAGVPDSREDHAEVLVEMAMRMVAHVEALSAETENALQIRIGIHSGPVVAGIIGTHRFLYDVWGDTVNVANRLETYGAPGRVQVSEATAKRVRHRFDLTEPTLIRVKGKGRIETCFVDDRRTITV